MCLHCYKCGCEHYMPVMWEATFTVLPWKHWQNIMILIDCKFKTQKWTWKMSRLLCFFKSSCKLAMTWSISCMNINDTLFFCILSLTWSIKCKIFRFGLAGVDNSTALGSTLIQLDKQQLRESVNSTWKCFHWNTQSKQNRGIGNKGSLPRL